jgi:hypothetical protein
VYTLARSNFDACRYSSRLFHFLFSAVQRKMATGQKRAFCILEFHSSRSVISVKRAFRRRRENTHPAANSTRKWCQKFKETGCISKGENSCQPSVYEETVDRVRQSFLRGPRKSTLQCSREEQVPQETVWRILLKRLALRPFCLLLLQAVTPTDSSA